MLCFATLSRHSTPRIAIRRTIFPTCRGEPIGVAGAHGPSDCPVTILIVTKERWAQIGITVQFLIVVRTLGEVFRLKHFDGTNFSAAVALSYVGGALIAACTCWVSVTLYFFRRYILSAWIALATIIVLFAYKILVIGR